MKWIIVLLNLAFIGASLQRTTTNKPTNTSPTTNNDFEEYGCQVTSNDKYISVNDCEKVIVLFKEIWDSLNTQVPAVRIKNCTIGLEQDSFSEFPSLHDVVINDSTIIKADPLVFNKVDRVNIQNTEFLFKPQFNSDQLEELVCNNCNLTEMPSLENLRNLVVLNLTNNKIAFVDEKTFANLDMLVEVSLAYNKLTSIPVNTFANNVLETLYLDGNDFSNIKLNSSSLESLSLQSSHLTEFDMSLTKVVSQLNLRDNDISTVTSDLLGTMPDLDVLDVSFNSIKSLDASVFSKNKNLGKIILDNNLLLSLPNFYLEGDDESFIIEYFSCNNCGLTSISKEVFANMYEIETLLLARNELEIIDENSFSNLEEVQKIDLSDNQIRMIGKNTFASNYELLVIHLAGNPLVFVDPALFVKNNKLQTLDVRCTKLNSLWLNHETRLPFLMNLYASDNNITDFTMDDFNMMPNLKTIDLTDNPLNPLKDWCPLIVNLKKRNVAAVKYEGVSTMGSSFSGNFIVWESLFKESIKDCTYIDVADDDEDDEDDEDENLNIPEPEDISNNMDLNLTPFDLNDDEGEDESSTDDYSNDYNYEDDNTREMRQFEETLKAANILSLTAAFICTAVIVLIAAVTITLCILKRNNNYNRNLPHLKIKLWNDAHLGQKKHSGSVYRPLSEDLSGPKTPKLSRYEFLVNPTVHTTNNP